jgi:hypothetical protein
MKDFLGGEIVSAIIQTFVGVLLTLLAYSFRRISNAVKTRNVRRFWKPFLSEKLTIIVLEYPVVGKDMLSNVAKIAGAGWLISKGMALSLAHLLDFTEHYVTKRDDITIRGDKTGSVETPNMIIIGSPVSNLHARSMYEHLCNMYEIPYRFNWKTDGTLIEIHTSDGNIIAPTLEDGLGEDFALVIKADYQLVPQKSVLIVAGSYMWATKAAAEAVTEHKILDVVAKETKNYNNVAFLIKTRIINDSALGPEIEIGNRRYISKLTKKLDNTKKRLDESSFFSNRST